MTETNSLPYYPRFIFNCSDGLALSTGDLELFKFIKEAGSNYDITRFVPGNHIEISWVNEQGQTEIRPYTINRIEIQQIKYDMDEPTYGINLNDSSVISGKPKKWMMEIYIFLDAV